MKTKPNAIIFDLDGTLTDYTHRAHYIASANRKERDWSAFFAEMGGDTPIQEAVALAQKGRTQGYQIILLTGRPDTYLALTRHWLAQHKIPYDVLLMRPGDDWRPGEEVKAEIYTRQIAPFYDVHFAVDDNPKIISMWQKLGVKSVLVGHPSAPETF